MDNHKTNAGRAHSRGYQFTEEELQLIEHLRSDASRFELTLVASFVSGKTTCRRHTTRTHKYTMDAVHTTRTHIYTTDAVHIMKYITRTALYSSCTRFGEQRGVLENITYIRTRPGD